MMRQFYLMIFYFSLSSRYMLFSYRSLLISQNSLSDSLLEYCLASLFITLISFSITLWSSLASCSCSEMISSQEIFLSILSVRVLISNSCSMMVAVRLSLARERSLYWFYRDQRVVFWDQRVERREEYQCSNRCIDCLLVSNSLFNLLSSDYWNVMCSNNSVFSEFTIPGECSNFLIFTSKDCFSSLCISILQYNTFTSPLYFSTPFSNSFTSLSNFSIPFPFSLISSLCSTITPSLILYCSLSAKNLHLISCWDFLNSFTIVSSQIKFNSCFSSSSLSSSEISSILLISLLNSMFWFQRISTLEETSLQLLMRSMCMLFTLMQDAVTVQYYQAAQERSFYWSVTFFQSYWFRLRFSRAERIKDMILWWKEDSWRTVT